MDIRTTSNPVIRWASRRLKTLNDRHPWNHNHHFHRWILRSLPDPAMRVLDVGCGDGTLLLRLAERADHVEGIDPNPEMATRAREACAGHDRIRVRQLDFDDLARTSEAGSFDAITMVASLHHMDVPVALAHVRRLLRPGGKLLVVTLAVPRTPVDMAWDIANALTNPLIGMVLHPRPVTEPAPANPMPVLRPQLSVDQWRQVCRRELPGARLRRREGFRATIAWQKPVVARPGPPV